MTAKSVQTGIGFPRETLQRIDRLRAVFGKSRSWTTDYALTHGGLDGAERLNVGGVGVFADLARTLGLTWRELADAYAGEFSRYTYPPSLDEIMRDPAMRAGLLERAERTS
jgi:hypothetical protein